MHPGPSAIAVEPAQRFLAVRLRAVRFVRPLRGRLLRGLALALPCASWPEPSWPPSSWPCARVALRLAGAFAWPPSSVALRLAGALRLRGLLGGLLGRLALRRSLALRGLALGCLALGRGLLRRLALRREPSWQPLFFVAFLAGGTVTTFLESSHSREVRTSRVFTRRARECGPTPYAVTSFAPGL